MAVAWCSGEFRVRSVVSVVEPEKLSPLSTTAQRFWRRESSYFTTPAPHPYGRQSEARVRSILAWSSPTLR